jgi:hypothetical protein
MPRRPSAAVALARRSVVSVLEPLEALQHEVEGELELELIVAPAPTTEASSW